MPKPLPYLLMWDEAHQRYLLHKYGQIEQCFSEGDEHLFSRFLDEHTAFAFHGKSGRASLLKETRRGGRGYWYACRTRSRHTYKRYLGTTPHLTLACVEQAVKDLSEAPALPVLAAEQQGQPNQQPPTLPTLLASRLSPPRLPSWLVKRSRLLDELEAIVSHSLTLISASAGSGKTTLLAAWATASSSQWMQLPRPQNAPACAWLSLEELDNDPPRLWTSCIAALRTRLPALGETALAMLYAQDPPPLFTVLVTLLREIEQVERELILILDDSHLLAEQAVQESLRFLLDHAPSNLHLVLSSRTDPELPLSRLRVHGHLLEFRDQDLRFTEAEAGSFLVEGMGLPLSEEEVGLLQSRTGGWVAGLQLAALSLRKSKDPSALARDFAGSHRFVLDYIRQDVLARLSNGLQQFLLQTSILTRLNAALCRAVTALPSQQACQELLEEAERANLFVIPLDEHRHWYRYHDLFREALSVWLRANQTERVPELHRRAAQWYESAGEWREAIVHALAAPDYPYAASLIRRAAPVFWRQGEVKIVHDWVLTLPDAVRRTQLPLVLSATFWYIDSVNLSNRTLSTTMVAQVTHTFAHLEKLLHEKQDWALTEKEEAFTRRRLSLLHAWMELRAIHKRGDIERLRHLSQELDMLPEDEEAVWKIIPLSFAFWLALPHPRASTTLIPKLWEAAQRMLEERNSQMAIRLKTMLAIIFVLNAQLHQAQQQCLQGLSLLQQTNRRASWEGHLYYSLFSVSYARNRLEEASHWLLQMRQAAQDWQQVELLIREQIYCVRLALAQGDLPLARHAWQTLETLAQREGFALHIPWIHAVQVQVWLAEGNLAEASSWAVRTSFSEETWDFLRRCEVLMLVRVLLAQQQHVLATQILERFSAYFQWPGSLQTEIEWMALAVVALHRSGKPDQARQVATRLLAITEPEGYIRLDLDTGEALMKEVLEIWLEAPPERISSAGTDGLSRASVLRMLAVLEQKRSGFARESGPLFSSSQSATQQALIQPLSRQERQVLRLLVTGRTYAEIARALIVSPNTIKTQVSSIYRKLGVSRRAEAIAVAARFSLL